MQSSEKAESGGKNDSAGSFMATLSIRGYLNAGWASLVLSAIGLWFTHQYAAGATSNEQLLFSLSLMGARLCGMFGFVMGVVGIFNRRWSEGSLLLLISLTLPFLSFLYYGTI